MSRFWRVAGVTALVAVMALATVAIVSAEEPQGRKLGQVGDLWERMHEAIANALGITAEQYDSAIETARSQVLQRAVDEGLLTEEQAEQMREDVGPLARGGRLFGRGMKRLGLRGPGSSLVNAAAEVLGMTVQDLVDELEQGKSIADVAGHDVTLGAIAEAWLADREEFLAQAVEAERITQDQADEMLAQIKEEVLEHLQDTWPWEHDQGKCEDDMEGLGGIGGQLFGDHGLRGAGSRGSIGSCGQ
jgi:hypothetical protein